MTLSRNILAIKCDPLIQTWLKISSKPDLSLRFQELQKGCGAEDLNTTGVNTDVTS